NPPQGPQDVDQSAWRGIYGFVELHDGRVLTFGGTMHADVSIGFLSRIDGPAPSQLLVFDPFEEQKAPRASELPKMPVTHIVEKAGAIMVFSYNDVFRVGIDLKSWQKIATLPIRYRSGRSDALGVYPSVRVVHPPRHAGEPFILATLADGYVLLDQG